jgi:hypothetical protein
MMHFLFSLLRIKGHYMFRALLAHPQEVYTSDTWYMACVMSVGCTRTALELILNQRDARFIQFINN